jgi:hypothetical protein
MMISCKKGARNTEALGELRAGRRANLALAIKDIGKGRHGDASTTTQLGLGQGMLLHEMAEPVNGCEIGMLVYRVLIVGNEQPKDIEVIPLAMPSGNG